MSTRLNERDCTPKAVLVSFMTLDLPDANDHDMSSRAGRQGYTTAWRRYEADSSVLGHKLAACLALAKRDRLATLLTKVSRFVEHSREFAVRTTEAHKEFEAATKAKDDDPFALLWIFGKPKEVKRRDAARDKRLMAISDKLIKEYDRLWRERELLRTQIQALVPETQQ